MQTYVMLGLVSWLSLPVHAISTAVSNPAAPADESSVNQVARNSANKCGAHFDVAQKACTSDDYSNVKSSLDTSKPYTEQMAAESTWLNDVAKHSQKLQEDCVQAVIICKTACRKETDYLTENCPTCTSDDYAKLRKFSDACEKLTKEQVRLQEVARKAHEAAKADADVRKAISDQVPLPEESPGVTEKEIQRESTDTASTVPLPVRRPAEAHESSGSPAASSAGTNTPSSAASAKTAAPVQKAEAPVQKPEAAPQTAKAATNPAADPNGNNMAPSSKNPGALAGLQGLSGAFGQPGAGGAAMRDGAPQAAAIPSLNGAYPGAMPAAKTGLTGTPSAQALGQAEFKSASAARERADRPVNAPGSESQILGTFRSAIQRSVAAGATFFGSSGAWQPSANGATLESHQEYDPTPHTDASKLVKRPFDLDSGGGEAGGAGGSSASLRRENLKEYLPTGKLYRPQHGPAGMVSNTQGIQSKAVDIWGQITQRLRQRCLDGRLRDCRISSRD